MSAAHSTVDGMTGEDQPSASADAGVPALVLRRVRALARRRLAWLEHLRAGGPNAATAGLGAGVGLLHPSDVQLVLDGRDAPEAEIAWRAGNRALDRTAREIEDCDRALAGDEGSPLAQLSRTFELSPAEREVVEVCWATVIDPGLSKAWAYLHGHPAQNHPSEMLIARLGGPDRPPPGDGEELPWAAGWPLPRSGPLFRWEIVTIAEASPGDPAPLVLDPHIAEFLSGRLTMDPLLAERAGVISPLDPAPSWPLAEVRARVRRILGEGLGARVSVVGPRRSGRRTFAACLTAAFGATALAVDTTGLAGTDWTAVHLHAQRQALLFGSSLIWHGEPAPERLPSAPGMARLQFVIGDGEFTVAAIPGLVDDRVTIPTLSLDERRAQWMRLVPVCRAWPERDFAELVERHRVQIGDIAWMGQHGIDSVELAKSECRKLTRYRLGDLGRAVDCPFRRADLMLPPNLNQLLDSLLFEARERAQFWESPAARRLFPRGRALVALMTGSPGTGKTMTAQVIAAELGLDLVRVDLASTVNKYIGETAKNLRRIFARAAEMNAVLLFDEADALFAKRTEVKDSHDRYANADTNYLLQLLEEFDGIALLASNRKQNIDSAFVRRLRFVMDFPRPKPAERLMIWQRLIAEMVGAERAEVLASLLRVMAETLDISGAQIKASVLSAIFMSRQTRAPLALDHLLAGVERELSKEGRGIEANDRERIVRHG
jgi:hypothetical protein